MYKLMLRIVLLFLISGIPAIQASPEKINILSTIKPVQLIVSAIAGDKAELEQLIPDYSSPHDYSFKPSDIFKIKKADIVFRIDEHLESILSPVLERMVSKDKLVSLAELDGMNLLAIGSEGHKYSHSTHEEVGEEIAKKTIDLHIWSSPKNSLVMAKSIEANLSKIDPSNASIYKSNFVKFEREIFETSKKIELIMAKVKNKPYITFHNSWHYFADYFGLHKPQVVSFHEGIGGNTKSILKIRKKIKMDKIGCIISDPNTSSSRIKTLIEDMQIKTEVIDVLGSSFSMNNIESGTAYVSLLEDMANKIFNCLK